MTINFHCTKCFQPLTVADDAVGRTAGCPACGNKQVVPGSPTSATSPDPGSSPFAPPQSPWEFRDQGIARPPSPFGPSPFVTNSPDNPYPPPSPLSSPFTLKTEPEFTGELRPTQVGMGDILTHAVDTFQRSFGVLLVSIIFVFGLNTGLAFVANMIEHALLEQSRDSFGMGAIAMVLQIPAFAIQTFLIIGLTQICLKISRRKSASVLDLFGGGSQFLPVIGATLIVALIAIPTALLIMRAAIFGTDQFTGPSLAIWAIALVLVVPYLIFWPYYHLLVDGKASILGSFSLAAKITSGNRITMFLMLLLLGFAFLAIFVFGMLCPGLLGGRNPGTFFFMIFAGACIAVLSYMFMFVLFATSYLMFSGQIPTKPKYGR